MIPTVVPAKRLEVYKVIGPMLEIIMITLAEDVGQGTLHRISLLTQKITENTSNQLTRIKRDFK
ncbi:unnamed protein product [Protopolystoma xenopodis]|uniref:Uncharacterized protein n=1 Tax=Protopolystoma xenopodis TaxID=117903 RepID=A0A3S5CL17_9PLAT|nr:unnamed protein product [Protopolystoma xenopodis]